jgi:ribonuclease R
MKAERETSRPADRAFPVDRIGASFSGRISGVTRAGLFVKLDETGADGFIPARTVGDDYYPLSRSAPCADRRPHRRELSARR